MGLNINTMQSCAYHYKNLVGPDRIELSTNRLWVHRSIK